MSHRSPTQGGKLAKLALAAIAAIGSVSWATVQYIQTRSSLHPSRLVGGPNRQVGNPHNFIETADGRQLLWARGPRDVATGEWFDITDSPLDSDGYQYGIGKDSIPAIDQPTFVAIDEREQLREHGIDDATIVIGYAHNGAAKAYPIQLMNRHELVNDEIGGKPVTVGW